MPAKEQSFAQRGQVRGGVPVRPGSYHENTPDHHANHVTECERPVSEMQESQNQGYEGGDDGITCLDHGD